MNKRLLYRNKIVRLYEEDIWGIFFRKQKKRDLFFRKIGYQLFLEIFRKNMRAVKPTTFAWKKKIYAATKKWAKTTKKKQKYILLLLKKKLNFSCSYHNNMQSIAVTNAANLKFNFFLYVKKQNNISTVLNWWNFSFIKQNHYWFSYQFKFNKFKTICVTKACNTGYRRFCFKKWKISTNFIILLKQMQRNKNSVFYWSELRTFFKVIVDYSKFCALAPVRSTLRNYYKVFAFLTKTYSNYCVPPLYLNIYFKILHKIYVFSKAVLFLHAKQDTLKKFFDLFDHASDSRQPEIFEIFLTQISPLFVKTNKDKHSGFFIKFGVNFFKFFNKSQFCVDAAACTKKILYVSQKSKASLIPLLNYFSLFIKIQQQHVKLQYSAFFLEVSDFARPFRKQNMAVNLETVLHKKGASNVIYTLQYFRFFLYLKGYKSLILKNFGKRAIFPFANKVDACLLRNFKKRNFFSTRQRRRVRKLRTLRHNKYVKIRYTTKTKNNFFYLPLTLRYCLKDKFFFTQQYYKTAYERNLLFIEPTKTINTKTKKKGQCCLKKQIQLQTYVLNRVFRVHKIQVSFHIKKSPFFYSLFFKFLFFKNFIFERMIRSQIVKIAAYIIKKEKLKEPVVWMALYKKNIAAVLTQPQRQQIIAYKHPYSVVEKSSNKKKHVIDKNSPMFFKKDNSMLAKKVGVLITKGMPPVTIFDISNAAIEANTLAKKNIKKSTDNKIGPHNAMYPPNRNQNAAFAVTQAKRKYAFAADSHQHRWPISSKFVNAVVTSNKKDIEIIRDTAMCAQQKTDVLFLKKKRFTTCDAAKVHYKKLLRWQKAKCITLRIYMREYVSGRLKTPKLLVHKNSKIALTLCIQKTLTSTSVLWRKYYKYWRHCFAGTFYKLATYTDNLILLDKYYKRIINWQNDSLNHFLKAILQSQRRLWYQEACVKQMFLYLHAHNAVTKLDLRVAYAYWCFTTKKDHLYYNFLRFKNLIYKSLRRRVHFIVKLCNTRAIRITTWQRLKLISWIPKLEAQIQYINSNYNNNNFDAFSFMLFILKTSQTRYILLKKLKKLPVLTKIRQYFIFHWSINQIFKKKIKPVNIKAHLRASKRLLTQLSIRTKYKKNQIFVESKRARKYGKNFVNLKKKIRNYKLFCSFIVCALNQKHIRFAPKRRRLISQKRVWKPKSSVQHINLCLSDSKKINFLKDWSILIPKFKQYLAVKKCLSVLDTHKFPLFLRLLKYTIFFKIKTRHQIFMFLARHLNMLKFSLTAQTHILYFFKKFLIKSYSSGCPNYFSIISTNNRKDNFTRICRHKRFGWTRYIASVNNCYKALIKTKIIRKRKFFFKKKKFLFKRFRNKYNIKRYFKAFFKQQFSIFFKNLYLFKSKSGKFLRYLKYIAKFGQKHKLRFLLRHSFRYAVQMQGRCYTFYNKNICFFRGATRVLTLGQISTYTLINFFKTKMVLLHGRYNSFLKIYLIYLFKVKSFVTKTRYLPCRVSNIFNIHASSFLFLKDDALPVYVFDNKWHTLYFLTDVYLYTQYKVYFYLLYKLWYLNQVATTFILYVKYFLYAQTKKQIFLQNKPIFVYSKFIVKNIFFRRLFNTIPNTKVLKMFKYMAHFNYFFKSWVFLSLKLFVDTLRHKVKQILKVGVKNFKRIKFSQKTNGYLFLRNLLNLYVIKWTVLRWKKFFYVNKNLINTLAYARRRARRLLYTVRSFFYQKYNKVPQQDSIFSTTLSDIIKANDLLKAKAKAGIKTALARQNLYDTIDLYIQYKQKFNTKNRRKIFELKHFLAKDTLLFKKTEYLLSFFASNHIYKYFNKLRRGYVNSILKKKQNNIKKNNLTAVKEYNSLFNFELLKKYSIFLFKKVAKIKKKIRFFSLRKRKTTLDRMFTLDLYPVIKYVKKKSSFKSFYKYRMLKVWKFRKFYGCLTNYELNSICLKAYKYRGDIIIQFIILLEARLDTILYRTGFVTSMFEARQLINHGNFLVNNIMVTKRSYVLKERDLLSFDDARIMTFTSRLKMRLKMQGLLFWPPSYLEVNYKYVLITFLYELLKITQIPYNFKLTGKDLNSILYYYY